MEIVRFRFARSSGCCSNRDDVDIVHGDLNPRNILILRENGAFVPKITDFESSCICASEEDLVTLPKTIPWDAPEWRDRWVTCRDAKGVDVYAFGLICFFTIFQTFMSEVAASSVNLSKS
jgi:serine/threonine protein kinase